jgi:hypothetical protein
MSSKTHFDGLSILSTMKEIERRYYLQPSTKKQQKKYLGRHTQSSSLFHKVQFKGKI